MRAIFTQSHAAKSWAIWEARTSKLFVDPTLVEKFGGDDYSIAIARIECHYFVNREEPSLCRFL